MSAHATPIRHGTPATPRGEPPHLGSSRKSNLSTTAANSPLPPPPPPPSTVTSSSPQPVIPTSWLSSDEQRRLFFAIFGLLEVMKLWDVIAPHLFSDLPTSWSSAARVRGPWTAGVWGAAELGAATLISLLRIPGLTPSTRQLALLLPVIFVWNLTCWFLADPVAFVPHLRIFGPVHLGEEGFLWGWLYLVKHIVSRLLLGEPDHISGKHTIRLLPYSTATLNPLSFTYCLPPGSREPIFVPVVFNNSAPDQVAYVLRALDGPKTEVQTVPAALMKRPLGRQALSLPDEEGDDEEISQTDPLSALIARSAQLDVARLHSVRPAESLTIIPPNLASSESLLYITVTRPSIIVLHSVVDKNGDRFHIAPHREAVVIECPTGGEFVDDDGRGGLSVVPAGKPRASELRCIGDDEVVKFNARGVAPLKVGWKKTSGGNVVSQGVVEGIEDDSLTEEEPRRERVSKTHTVPLRVQHERPGEFAVTLTTVVDALQNTYTPSGHASTIAFNVLSRRSVSLVCTRPIDLLVNRTETLTLRVDGPIDRRLEVAYSFTSITGDVSRHTMAISKPQEMITVSEPGTFTLLDVDGMCAGTVLEPSSCVVQVIPPPTAEVSVTTLHECAMDVGVTATFEFTGSPPFNVQWKEKRRGAKEVTRQQRFDSANGRVELRPEREGQYTYTFLTLSDARYKNLPLNQEPIEQVVHPPATIDIEGTTRHALFACSGNEIDVDLAIKGNEPLSLSYRMSWGAHSEDVTVPIRSGKQRLTVPIPSELSAHTGASGKLTITLVSVEDANGCVKRLPPRLIEVDVNRQKPTARFARHENVLVKDGEVVEVPLRLTGQGPWEVVYSRDGTDQRPITLRSSNSPLRFAAQGTYQLSKVRDANCAGDVDSSKFSIAFKPRPNAYLDESSAVRKDGSVYRHKGLCAGEEDAVAVQFVGASPFEVEYKYLIDSRSSDHFLKSAQDTGVLHLSTEPGRHQYKFSSVRDANYDRTPVSFVLEHNVHARPSVTYVRQNLLSLCRDSPLVSDARVRFTGSAPFTLILAVRKPASADVTMHTVTVASNEWTLELPHIILIDVGRYEISLVSVADASGCEQVVADTDILATTLEVVETARVVPVIQNEDVCVGDTLDFLLQGKAPWVVEYEWQRKLHTVTSSASRFSRVADAEGVFAIRSVALKDRAGNSQCKREVSGLERKVHPLPSVRIQDGLDNLREGDQPAAFTVSFTGTPPFTFTYTRSEYVGSKPHVVEAQTISDVWSDSYTISSSSPGEYTVTSVSDKYCRYPPLSRVRTEA